ncbi:MULTISPECIES: hypothetical protein [unclassified Streptomyces]|uniref:hypothetical protein n=1 Tax=unclassified Streptomyces TaxID=2593676 RepID=UPI000F6CC8B6|nr:MULTISPECIES: hypothetical protein [unclassified Streptomyces]AZM61711.1 hypothetical protein DLM49_21080 [Streptomyces sp. WAC 01438]RSN02163.1 hypothetical protein DMA10_00235 [Streptomyces sp. WAC 01420]
MLKSRVRKNLAIGLVITTVMTTVLVGIADHGDRMEELTRSLIIGLLMTGAVTGGAWVVDRKRSAP